MSHSSRPILMGNETEYAVSGRAGPRILNAEEVASRLLEAMKQNEPFLPDSRGGASIFLGTGGRTYLEIGGKFEAASPECTTPAELARFDKAAERLMARARETLMRADSALQVAVFKNNVSVADPNLTTWGNHELHLLWEPIEAGITPLLGHLASRFYAGSGLIAASPNGIGFELSQRARHIACVASPDTTSHRPLYCTRLKEGDVSKRGWTRVHLITKDSQRSPFGIYLTFGTTALLFHLISIGRAVGAALTPQDPVAAIKVFSGDPWLKARVPMTDGRSLSAIEIQESYLEACERIAQTSTLPDWAPELLRHWRETLETARRDPLELADRLDPFTKLRILAHHLERSGLTWSELNTCLGELALLRKQLPGRLSRAILLDDWSSLTTEEHKQCEEGLTRIPSLHGSSREKHRLVARLQALDLKYHELGGLYDRLEALGQVRGVVLEPADADRARNEAPRSGRGSVRGAFVRRYHGQGWKCDWLHIQGPSPRERVDLSDPFLDPFQVPLEPAPAATSAEPTVSSDPWGPWIDISGLLGRLRGSPRS